MKISLIQTNAVADKAANFAAVSALVERAVKTDKPDWISLSEHFEWAGGNTDDKLKAASPIPGGDTYEFSRALAKTHKIWLHAGSMYESIPGKNKAYNTTVVFDREGREVVRYRKIHLFDITTPDGTEYRESETFQAGGEVVVYDCEGVTVGCAICYDLRFPELFQALAKKGAKLIALPSAFTQQTGRDHWEVLCRARAIETETYILAAAQCGPYAAPQGKTLYTYGHSLVVDPWGRVVAKAADAPKVVSASIDFALIDRVREQIPLARHKVL